MSGAHREQAPSPPAFAGFHDFDGFSGERRRSHPGNSRGFGNKKSRSPSRSRSRGPIDRNPFNDTEQNDSSHASRPGDSHIDNSSEATLKPGPRCDTPTKVSTPKNKNTHLKGILKNSAHKSSPIRPASFVLNQEATATLNPAAAARQSLWSSNDPFKTTPNRPTPKGSGVHSLGFGAEAYLSNEFDELDKIYGGMGGNNSTAGDKATKDATKMYVFDSDDSGAKSKPKSATKKLAEPVEEGSASEDESESSSSSESSSESSSSDEESEDEKEDSKDKPSVKTPNKKAAASSSSSSSSSSNESSSNESSDESETVKKPATNGTKEASSSSSSDASSSSESEDEDAQLELLPANQMDVDSDLESTPSSDDEQEEAPAAVVAQKSRPGASLAARKPAGPAPAVMDGVFKLQKPESVTDMARAYGEASARGDRVWVLTHPVTTPLDLEIQNVFTSAAGHRNGIVPPGTKLTVPVVADGNSFHVISGCNRITVAQTVQTDTDIPSITQAVTDTLRVAKEAPVQPTGLRARFLPIGVEAPTSSALGNDDMDMDVDSPSPAAAKKSKKDKKQKTAKNAEPESERPSKKRKVSVAAEDNEEVLALRARVSALEQDKAGAKDKKKSKKASKKAKNDSSEDESSSEDEEEPKTAKGKVKFAPRSSQTPVPLPNIPGLSAQVPGPPTPTPAAQKGKRRRSSAGEPDDDEGADKKKKRKAKKKDGEGEGRDEAEAVEKDGDKKEKKVKKAKKDKKDKMKKGAEGAETPSVAAKPVPAKVTPVPLPFAAGVP